MFISSAGQIAKCNWEHTIQFLFPVTQNEGGVGSRDRRHRTEGRQMSTAEVDCYSRGRRRGEKKEHPHYSVHFL